MKNFEKINKLYIQDLEELKKFRDPYNDFKKVINKNIE